MKVKTKELIDAALDWAVALAKDEKDVIYAQRQYGRLVIRLAGDHETPDSERPYSPSSLWAQGGPIIEWEEIGSFHYIHGFHGPTWSARIGSGGFQQDGPTLLIAAMRCFCASRLGDEVDIPDELA